MGYYVSYNCIKEAQGCFMVRCTVIVEMEHKMEFRLLGKVLLSPSFGYESSISITAVVVRDDMHEI